MTNASWRPLGQTAAQGGALYDEMTDWLAESFWQWARGQFVYTARGGGGFTSSTYEVFDRDLAQSFERSCRVFIGKVGSGPSDGMGTLRNQVTRQRAEYKLADFLVRDEQSESDKTELDTILREGGSAWRVGTRNGFPGLERRVSEGVQDAADQAMTTPGHAGMRLSEAWHAVYGVNPDPSKAYAQAVKAVEDATIPTVTAAHNATLATVIRQLESDGDWRLPLTREDPAAPSAQTIVGMVRGLWKGHHDRHGGVPTAPAAVNQDEAEAAVHLAVFLVQAFASGLIARR